MGMHVPEHRGQQQKYERTMLGVARVAAASDARMDIPMREDRFQWKGAQREYEIYYELEMDLIARGKA